EPRAVVLLLPDLTCDSVEAESPLADLAHGWARAGFDTLRFDRRGIGDSEGSPCGDLDFATELADAAAALGLALARARERDVPLVVFGHGAGGIAAASLAVEHPVRGVIVLGTPSSRWLASLADTARRHGELRGDPPEAIEREAGAIASRTLADGAAGRSAAYHVQLDALDPAALWTKLRAPLLVLRGEHDWIVHPDDQGRLASLVSGPSSVVDLPGLDHALGWHEDREASLRDYGAGRFDASIVQITAEWIERR
ncbi:MAG TPA: alpha/beta fold hydrolase, partial [Kofleriaceae bacterium]|nr:alpha/beta fold hydrolase [Kofleriaceae bacterium]